MTTRSLLAFTCCVIVTSAFAAEQDAKGNGLKAIVAGPLPNSKTTFRFTVKNIGKKGQYVQMPFVDVGNASMRLLVAYPDGTKYKNSPVSDMPAVNLLSPGKKMSWDIDLEKFVQFKQAGRYSIQFSVNGTKSNTIVFVKTSANKTPGHVR